MRRNLDKNRSFLICLSLVIVTFAVFYQVHSFEFINYDDPDYVYQNQNVQTGLTLKAINWAFTTAAAANWHPVTWLSHILDWQLYGENAAGHHITNLIFHIINTLLLFLVLRRMTGALWQSAFVAALFALHPLHVESVAWVAERKDVLSTFFWFLTMWAYIRFVSRPKITNYLLIIVFFALGLMSKPMLVTLPFVLLLLDYWPLERLNKQYSFSYLLVEKIPLFVMALASSIVTFLVQRTGGAMAFGRDYGLSVRIANAFISYLIYIGKMIWPAKLAVLYPYPDRNILFWGAVLSVVLLAAITILILRLAKKHKYLVTGWFWYLGTLVPVIGFIQVGVQSIADRYTYITLTGLFIIIAWGIPELLAKWQYKKNILISLTLPTISVLAIITFFQLHYWRDSITLFQHTLDVTKNNYMAHFCIAEPLGKKGRMDEAVEHCSQAIGIMPDFVPPYFEKGNFLHMAGRLNEAAEQYQKCLKIKPEDPNTLNSIGFILCQQGKLDQAAEYFTRALRIKPDFSDAHSNLGFALANMGKFDQALKHYQIAVGITDTPQLRRSLGYILVNLGRFDEAVAEYRRAVSAMPDNPGVLNEIGYALAGSGKYDEAIANFRLAISIAPNYTEAKNNLNTTLAKKQKLQDKDAKKE